MKKQLFLTFLTFITLTTYGQAKTDNSLALWASSKKPQDYLILTNVNYSDLNGHEKLNIIIGNPDGQIQKNHQAKRRLFVTLTIPMVAAYLVSNQANKKDLAAGFAVGGLVTSSLGFYFMIKEDKQKKGK